MAAKIGFMGEAWMFRALWSVLHQLDKPRFLSLWGFCRKEALGAWSRGKGLECGPRQAEDDPAAGKPLMWRREGVFIFKGLRCFVIKIRK